MTYMIAMLATMVSGGDGTAGSEADYPIRPVPFTNVQFADIFWRPRLDTNTETTVWYDFQQCEQTGRIENFAIAGGLKEGKFEGYYFNDSDVFKVIEGAAYTLAIAPNPKLDQYLDDLIAKIAAAQEDDGYLYTIRTIRGEDIDEPAAGPERWSNLRASHELYNVGHLYEAAVAHYLATGKRTLLDVALKNADLIARVFGPEAGKRKDPPGHQEIELGLVRLHRVTGDRKYLDLAKFFLDQRGNADGHELYGEYSQDHKPVLQQAAAVGHAVRAGYMYAAMADVAALADDPAYVQAVQRIWKDVVRRKLYITGGIGARRAGEAFDDAYVLPNAAAYNETCAAIANAMWNHRMFLLHGDAQYLDVLERVIYNGFLSGISMNGQEFFYPNPLSFDGCTRFNHGQTDRAPWFGCSCCPVNVVRFIPSIPGFVYAVRDQRLYVNLYVGGSAQVDLDGTPVELEQETRYPWEGAVRLTVKPEKPTTFALRLRIPGWARGTPVPGDLYRYVEDQAGDVALRVNGADAPLKLDRGFAVIEREWQPGDVVELTLPLEIRRVLTHDQVESNRGLVALERGPIVYCFESVDNGNYLRNAVVPDDAQWTAEFKPDLLNGVVVLQGTGERVVRTEDGGTRIESADLVAVPYYAWAHRAPGPMEVWVARTPDAARPRPLPTIASESRAAASHTWHMDTEAALNDQLEPQHSNDQGIPRFTWWNHQGTDEWVAYEFAEPTEVSRVDVYWFDDGPRGGCHVPKSWRLLYQDKQGEWHPVPGASKAGVEKDCYNTMTFDPVLARGLRIEVSLPAGSSGGILEWKVQ